MLVCLSKGKLGLPVGASLAEHRTKSPEGQVLVSADTLKNPFSGLIANVLDIFCPVSLPCGIVKRYLTGGV